MNFTIKTLDGENLYLSMNNNDTVEQLKLKIENKLGFNIDEQKLILRKQILYDNNRKLNEYGNINNNNIIYFYTYPRNDELLIFVKSLDGTLFQINISKHDKVSSLKTKIYQKKSSLLPKDQKLVFQGGILEDIRTLADYNVNNNSVINVVTCLKSGNIQIFIKLMDGRTSNIYVMKSDTIRSVKNKIQEKLGIKTEVQEIIFQGDILQDDGSVEFYEIENYSWLLIIERRSQEIEMKIFVKVFPESIISLKVKNHKKIITLKKQIQNKLGILPEYQHLVFQGIYIEDEKTINYYEISENDCLNMVSYFISDVKK